MAERVRPSARERGDRRVVVTGMGAITPIGNDVASYWESLVAGRSGIRRIESFDPVNVDCKVAGEVVGFEADLVMPRKEVRRNDRYVHFAWAASAEALARRGPREPDHGRGPGRPHRRDHRLGDRRASTP